MFTLHTAIPTAPLRTFNKSVFRGLQNEKAPTTGKENTEFGQSWCKILNHSSVDLMLLTVEPASKELSSIKPFILELRNKLKPCTTKTN